MLSDFKNSSELTIFKINEHAGILKRTPQGCEFKLTTEFTSKNNSPLFSYRSI
ncbi:MAG: hypothetical protein PSV35_00855 [bacterium]|nr:hypothetical protein [bacterium]